LCEIDSVHFKIGDIDSNLLNHTHTFVAQGATSSEEMSVREAKSRVGNLDNNVVRLKLCASRIFDDVVLPRALEDGKFNELRHVMIRER
jgi:hypothetical protein